MNLTVARLGMNLEGDSGLIGDQPSEGQLPNQGWVRECPEADAYAIILEWGLPSSKHTDRGLWV